MVLNNISANIEKRLRKWSIQGKFSLFIIMLYIIVAVFAPYISIYPHDISSAPPLIPPGGKHFMGTDELGYDLWSQIAYGARISLLIGSLTSILSVIIGSIIGSLSGYLGGWIDKLIMRLVDIMISIPELPLIILLATFLGPSLINIVIVLVIFSWTRTARIVRAQVMVLKNMNYVTSARTYGASAGYLLRVHFLKELFPVLAINAVRLVSKAIIAEASLSFLGLGDPTSKSWGLILNHALGFSGIYHTDFWKWWVVFPWLAISLLVISLAFITRDIEKLCDPNL